ncbi:MAG: DUF192 domain-containing protein [Patescibacteria group bacterium]
MSKSLNKFMIGGAVAVVILLLGFTIWSGLEAKERAVVTANDQDFSVRIADSPWERQRGLSGFEAKEVEAQGMLFLFKDSAVREFWMKGMKLDLDVVWIQGDKVVAVSSGVKAPKSGEEPVRMSSKPIPVDMVLELPAGYASQFGITPGVSLKIQLP